MEGHAPSCPPVRVLRHGPDVTYPDGATRIEQFVAEPFPRWVYRLDDGTRVEQSLFVPRELPAVIVSWKHS